MTEPHTHPGSIPVLAVEGHSLAEMWENSLLRLWGEGCRIRTQYDEKDKMGEFLHPPSVDATLMMTCTDPASEPAIHRCFPGGLEDLEEYRMEVIEGIKDHWATGGESKWKYTYHQRLTKYRTEKLERIFPGDTDVDPLYGSLALVGNESHKHVYVNQLDAMVKQLAKSPISRRVQAVTWKVWEDPTISDPPCLQSIWARILPVGGQWYLNMNVRFRSRDAYDAAFMNAWALAGTQGLQGHLARQIAEKAGVEVRLGHYCDLSDSYHIYGRRHQHFEESFLTSVRNRTFEDRTWTREFAQPIFDEARPKIMEKVKAYDERNGRA